MCVPKAFRGRSELPQRPADRNGAFASAKNPTDGEVGEVQRASRHDLVRALAPRYAHAGKGEKGQVLDQVCAVTGYTRKYALMLLKHPPPEAPPVKHRRRRSPSYGSAEVELLQLCWLVTDGICAKRLAERKCCLSVTGVPGTSRLGTLKKRGVLPLQIFSVTSWSGQVRHPIAAAGAAVDEVVLDSTGSDELPAVEVRCPLSCSRREVG
jgi:hypothetical protein